MTCKKGLGSSGGHLDGMVRAAFLRTEMNEEQPGLGAGRGKTGEGGEGKPGKSTGGARSSTKSLKQEKNMV